MSEKTKSFYNFITSLIDLRIPNKLFNNNNGEMSKELLGFCEKILLISVYVSYLAEETKLQINFLILLIMELLSIAHYKYSKKKIEIDVFNYENNFFDWNL